MHGEYKKDPNFIYICEYPVQSPHEVQGKWDQFRVSKKSCSLGSGQMLLLALS